jgi:thioredoxin 1
MMHLRRSLVFLVFAACLSSFGVDIADSTNVYRFSDLPVKGVVTMIDLGAEKCIPCKMMAPIMAKLEKAYAGRAAIVFIDVWKNEEQVGRFGIRAIPTQLFFNEDGKEVYRHVGFMSEEDIVAQLEKMGVR